MTKKIMYTTDPRTRLIPDANHPTKPNKNKKKFLDFYILAITDKIVPIARA